MPIYEYQCRQCGEEFELLVLKNTVAACPSCQSTELDQLISGFAVSSEEKRQANVKAARQAALNGKTYKDQKVAEAEEIREHSGQYAPVKQPRGKF